MRSFIRNRPVLLLKLTLVLAGQMPVAAVLAQPGQMEQKTYNYTSFGQPVRSSVDEEVIRRNKGYETHPELGMLFAEAPCANCYEILSRRTEKTKTFSEKGTDGEHIWVQSSTAPMHYRDKQGNWRTIQAKLSPEVLPGIFSAVMSPMPVHIDTRAAYATAGMPGRRVMFNRRLELLYMAADGTEQTLGQADWSRYTAGEDGVYITEIWPGIDMEITVFRGAVKTNFFLNRPMPLYAGGQMVIRDHMEMDEGLMLFRPATRQWKGGAEIKYISGQALYTLGAALVYEKRNAGQKTLLDYRVPDSKSLDILIPGSWLSRPEAAYPVVIDPLLQDSNSIAAVGTEYASSCNSPTGGCIYVNPVPVPPAVTVTDLFFSFRFVTDSPAFLNTGAFEFKINACGNSLFYSCQLPSSGPRSGFCFGTHLSIWPQLRQCIPPPSCESYDLPVAMRFLRCYGTDPGCVARHVYGVEPLIVTVEGHTVELQSIAGDTTICEDDSAKLTALGKYGVPPYTYTWEPGSLDGSSVMVGPRTDTRYTLVITDQCGNTTPDTSVGVHVKPRPAPPDIMSNTPVCEGKTLSLGASGTGEASYAWTGPNGYQSAAADTTIPDVSPSWSGIYYATRTVNGCTSRPDSVAIFIQPLPDIALQADATDICMGDSVRLETVRGPSYFYRWDPGAYFLTNSGPVAYAVLLNTGYLHIRVTDSLACASTDSIYIHTRPCCELYLPNAFTPNADGKNDLFRVITEGKHELEIFRIVNRWGQVVFTTTDKRKGWDGTWHGVPQEAGTYYYYVTYKCLNGVEYERKGDVTLLR